MIIKGERGLILRPADICDGDFLSETINNPVIIQYAMAPRPYSKQAIRELIEKNESDRSRQFFVIDVSNTKTSGLFWMAVGCCWLSNIDGRNQNADVGVIIRKEYQNAGFAPLSLEALIDYAFKFLNLRRLNAVAYEEQRKEIYLALGFLQEGVAREKVFICGKFCNELTFGLLRSEWKGLQL